MGLVHVFEIVEYTSTTNWDETLMPQRWIAATARAFLSATCFLVLNFAPPFAIAQTVTYPPPGSAPNSPVNPSISTTLTQDIEITGCQNTSQNGSSTSTATDLAYVLTPFSVQGSALNTGDIDWAYFPLPTSLQPGNALTVVNGVSQASGSAFAPSSISGSEPSIGVTADTTTYTASVSGVTLNEQWIGNYAASNQGADLITQNETYTYTSSYVITTGVQTYTYQWQAVQVESGNPYAPGCVSTTTINQLGTGTVDWMGTPTPAPSINTSLPAGKVGVAYPSATLVSGGTPPYTITAPGLPAGLQANTDGTVTGTPTAGSAQPIMFSVTVTDTAGQTAGPTSVSILVSPSLVIVSSLPSGTIGTPYPSTETVSGGTPPYQATISGLPSGLVGAPDGTISGTPGADAPANNSVTISASDSAGVSAGPTTLPLIISSGRPLKITTYVLDPIAVTTNHPYSTTILVAGGTPPYTWGAAELPKGLTFNTNADGSLTISGVPTEPSPDLPLDVAPPAIFGSPISVQVTDAAGATTSQDYLIYISGFVKRQYATPQERNQDFLTFLGTFGASALIDALLAEPGCAEIPICLKLAQGLIGGLTTTGTVALLNAIDPLDPNFRVLAEPPKLPVSLVSVGTGITKADAEIINSLLRNIQRQAELRWVVYQSINRAQAAAVAPAPDWEIKQLMHAKQYALLLSRRIREQQKLSPAVVAIEPTQFSLNTSQIAALNSSIVSGKLSPGMLAALKQAGFTSAMISEFQRLLQTLPPSSFPTTFPSFLTDPDYLQTEKATVTNLRQFTADRNNDLKVDLKDVEIVKNALWSKLGDRRYDVRADVNGDGVVDWFDLKFVKSQLPKGTVCAKVAGEPETQSEVDE
jgi:hypothetical protein